jgi:hypothetical protein
VKVGHGCEKEEEKKRIGRLNCGVSDVGMREEGVWLLVSTATKEFVVKGTKGFVSIQSHDQDPPRCPTTTTTVFSISFFNK